MSPEVYAYFNQLWSDVIQIATWFMVLGGVLYLALCPLAWYLDKISSRKHGSSPGQKRSRAMSKARANGRLIERPLSSTLLELERNANDVISTIPLRDDAYRKADQKSTYH